MDVLVIDDCFWPDAEIEKSWAWEPPAMASLRETEVCGNSKIKQQDYTVR